MISTKGVFMRSILALGLLTLASGAFSGTDFGAINFHSSVPNDQLLAMTTDLRYLFDTPVKTSDAEFKSLLGLKEDNGPEMHNWLVNRVRHIIGESFELEDKNIRVLTGYVFPNTPIPQIGQMAGLSQEGESSGVKTIMSNLGSALYLVGKKGVKVRNVMTPVLYGLSLDGETVYATSTRVGIIKVGEGLFFKDFRVTEDELAPANSISRLGTFFHEARHSDGNGKSTGFAHDRCPITHPYANNFACEKSANGSYSVGALTLRNLVANCTACTEKEKTTLQLLVLDSFDRILSGDNARARLSIYEKTKTQYQDILKAYIELAPSATGELKTRIESEMKKITDMLVLIDLHMALLKNDLNKVPAPLDASPEGLFRPVSLQESIRAMSSSKLK